MTRCPCDLCPSRGSRARMHGFTLLEVLERTAWHAGQHTRQLMLALEKLGVTPAQTLTEADFSGLPMPRNIWDNEKTWD